MRTIRSLVVLPDLKYRPDRTAVYRFRQSSNRQTAVGYRYKGSPMGLEAVRENRDDLEELAESDLRTSKYAKALLEAADAEENGE